VTDITAIVLTHNETLHIGRCLERLRHWCAKIVVVDSFSSDDTVAIARAAGAEVHSRAFINQAEQFQWALDTIPIPTGWVVRVDADEYFEPALIAEIVERLPTLDANTTGVVFRRKMIFRGRWIRWGTYYPVFLLRLFRAGAARMEQRWMDEHLQLTHGNSVVFTRGDFVDENLQTIGAWTDKHNRYATRHMVDFVGRRAGLIPTEPMPTGRKPRTKRWLREKVFGKAPLYLRSWLYFNYRYFARLGFLDGRQGFVWHFLHGFWFFMLIDAKIDEAERQIAAHGEASLPQWLADRYGFADLLPGSEQAGYRQ
jgi:glycosyltransferase involved in cell wall biosynthesis